MHWVLLLLLTNYIITIRSQTWPGTFVLDSTCNINTCCCLSNRLQLTALGTSILAFNTSLAGALCAGQISYSGQGSYPTGYVNTISVSVITLTMTLSSDSNMLSITNSLDAVCTTNGVRQTMMTPTTTTNILLTSTTTATLLTGTTTTALRTSTNVAEQNQHISPTTLFSLVLFSIVMYNSMT